MGCTRVRARVCVRERDSVCVGECMCVCATYKEEDNAKHSSAHTVAQRVAHASIIATRHDCRNTYIQCMTSAISRLQMRHITHVNASCLASESARIGLDCRNTNIQYMSESCHTYKWVTLHMWMNHVSRPPAWQLDMIAGNPIYSSQNQSCHAYTWVTPHVWMRHVSRPSAR